MVLVILFGFLLGSCKKFLDVPGISDNVAIKTAEDCQLLMDNFSVMNALYPSDADASADNYYFHRNKYNQLDLEGRNLYTWNRDALRETAILQWANPYKVVQNANVVLNSMETIKNTADQTTLDGLKGTALFFRSFAFWTVAQMYAAPYVPGGTNDSPGIPLRTSADMNDVFGRGSVQQTYDQIINDLKEAAALLPATSIVVSRPNKAAAYAMLARTYLSMEDYGNALVNANAALQLNSNLLNYSDLADSPTPFTRFSNKEVIFHAIMGNEGNPAANLLFPGFSAFSPAAIIVPELYDAYDANDKRKELFFDPNLSLYAGTVRFSGNYDQNTGGGLFTGLAVDEVYLTRAECYARAGELGKALADLNTLLNKRWVAGTYTDLSVADPATDTQDEVLAKILLERRKELVMRGLRWTDLRRLNRDNRFKKDLTRTVTTGTPPDLVTTTYTLPANDPRYVLLIPRYVIEHSNIPQNKR